MKKKNVKRAGEWIKVCGVNVPKKQLEEAQKELNFLMLNHETQYLRMQEDIKDPDKDFDVHTLLDWAQIFYDNGKHELVEISLKKVENILEKALQDDLSWENSFNVAMIYGRDLDMPEKTIELMDDLAICPNAFDRSVAFAELYVGALGDRMNATEYYRDAEQSIKTLHQRCILAQSVMKYVSQEWGEEIYLRHLESELENPCFENLFPIIDILEDINPYLASEATEKLLKLAEFDKSKLEQFLTQPWAAIHESEIKEMLKKATPRREG